MMNGNFKNMHKKYIIAFVILFFLLIFITSILQFYYSNIGSDYSRYISGKKITSSSVESDLVLNKRLRAPLERGDVIDIDVNLKNIDTEKAKTFYFAGEHVYVRAYLDGRQIYSIGRQNYEKGRDIEHIYPTIRVESGRYQNLKIRMTVTASAKFMLFQDTYFYDTEQSFLFFLRKNAFNWASLLVILFLPGVMSTIILLLSAENRMRLMMHTAFAIFILLFIVLWNIANTGYYMLFSQHVDLWLYVQNSAKYMIPFFVSSYAVWIAEDKEYPRLKLFIILLNFIFAVIAMMSLHRIYNSQHILNKLMYILLLVNATVAIIGMSRLNRSKVVSNYRRLEHVGVVLFIIIVLMNKAAYFLMGEKSAEAYFYIYATYVLGFVFIYSFILRSFALFEEKQIQIERMREKEHRDEIRLLVAQIKPHFLINALASIREVSYQDSKTGGDLIYAFSKYLRAKMNSVEDDKCISFDEEMEIIDVYLEIESMNLDFEVERQIEASDFVVPRLAIEPFVENAIKHGLKKAPGQKCLFIKAERQGEGYCITVRDNGKGMKNPEKILENGGNGVGIKNSVQRLKNINAEVSIRSEGEGKGTEVKIFIGGENADNCSGR